MTSNSRSPRFRRVALASVAAGAAFALSACGAGIHTQTGQQLVAVDGASTDAADGHVTLRNVLLQKADRTAGQDEAAWEKNPAHLAFTISLDSQTGAPDEVTVKSIKVNGKTIQIDAKLDNDCQLVSLPTHVGDGSKDATAAATTSGTATTETAAPEGTAAEETVAESSDAAASDSTGKPSGCTQTVEASKVEVPGKGLRMAMPTDVEFTLEVAGKTETVTVPATLSTPIPHAGAKTDRTAE